MNDAERRHFEGIVEQKQAKDFFRLYSNIMERCFTDCVSDFTSKSLQSKEETCVNRCIDKYFVYMERVGNRFGEHQQQLVEEQMRASGGK